MSEPVSSRTDAVVPDPQTSATAAGSGGLAPLPPHELESSSQIERLSERLRFYESFDELIQQNIARSGQLLREAGEKRDEAVATIAQSRRQIEIERETQRSALTELLDDVMTIQQATERLAHRVSDALEQIEFELEPIGLQGASSLSGDAPARLAGRAGGGLSFPQTAAEDVHDEVNRGVIGHRAVAAPDQQSSSMTPRSASMATEDAEATPAPPAASWSSAAATTHNPETEAPARDEPVPRDVGSASGRTDDQSEDREAAPGDGADGAPVESSAESWVNPGTVAGASGVDDLSRVAEPTSPTDEDPTTSREPRAEESEATATEEVSSELVGLAPAEPENETHFHPESDRVATETEPAATLSGTEDKADPLTSDALDSSALASETDDRSDAASPTTSAPTNGVSAPVMVATGTTAAAEPTPPPSGSGLAEPNAEPVEQQTTVVLDGVPRAAIALALQRHILSKPDVLRAEVREYYDHRLTLFVTGRRATTADDLNDWDGAASWEQIRTSPELLELRMVM